MFCSTIIPTIGRSTLAKAVHSVLDQSFYEDAFEVIVVNDSGQPLPPEPWQNADRVRIIDTQRRKLSVARNSGAAIARGRYLHFLDDDDWLAPKALQNFYALAQANPQAVWLYGGAQFVDGDGHLLGELNLARSGNCAAQLLAGSWIPAQVSCLQTDSFFAAGGFNPLFGPTEEMELGRRMALQGDFAHTDAVVVSILRGRGWVTTAHHDQHPEFNRWSREIALGMPGAFTRLRASADSSYWRARIFHAYLTSTLWNTRHKRLLTAGSRGGYALSALLLAGRHALSGHFWQAVRDTQVPCSEVRVLQRAANKLHSAR